ncbi:MAG TPA: hypothetical protein VGA70_04780 [Longimicrobiales bacterium]|jgi:hypothetical protein
MLILKILGGIAALLLGVWLGLPGRYEQSTRDIERAMDQGGAKRRQVKRHFTFINWLHKDRKASERRRQRSRFKTAAPKRGSDR